MSKTVLLINGTTMFQDFLRDKFSSEMVTLECANQREAYTKVITILPTLIILELQEDIGDEAVSLLSKKRSDPNAKNIPVIISGPSADRSKVASLAEYGVVKYFNKPIKFDVFFASVGKILKMNFSMDTTRCIIDLHVNGSIIFVELAQGLNREKILILKYRLIEIIKNHNITSPKLILMLTALELSFIDGANIELLLDNVTADNKIANKNIKILSFDTFIRELISGHRKYDGMEVSQNLQDVMASILNQKSVYDKNEYAVDRILNAERQIDDTFVEARISSDSGATEKEGNLLKIAVVDDDVVVRKLLQNSFSGISGDSVLFENGTDFMKAVQENQVFDIVILDMFLPDSDGINILKNLQRMNYPTPIIVYSRAAEKDFVMQALALGAKSYLVKPQKPNVIINKVLEIIHYRNS